MQFPAFVGGSYQSQAYTADQERTVNWYVERIEAPGGSSRSALYPTPGVETIVTATTQPGRGHFFENDREFTVCGNTLYEIGQFGTLSSRGTVAIDGNPATICSNGDGGGQLFVTSGGNGYVYDLTANTLTQIAALNGKATMGDFLDGYFLCLNASNSTFYISALLDGTSWATGTDFAQRSTASDPWVSMKVTGRYVWLLGEVTSEVWYDTGASPFPFAAHPSGLVQYGIAAPFSVARIEGALVWLGSSGIGNSYVLRAPGFAPEVVSNYALQSVLAGYIRVSDAVADTYNDLGHTFYVISFPGQNATWAWDAQTGDWAERGTWNVANNRFDAWSPRFHSLAFGEHRILDSASGGVYRLSSTLMADAGGALIRRVRRAPALTAENERIFYSAFELDLEPGVGVAAGNAQDVDPQVMMRMSNDGGKTWGAEMMRSAGKIGEYKKRVRWNRLGAARRRVFEVSVTAAVPWRITNAFLTLGQSIRSLKGQQQQAQQ